MSTKMDKFQQQLSKYRKAIKKRYRQNQHQILVTVSGVSGSKTYFSSTRTKKILYIFYAFVILYCFFVTVSVLVLGKEYLQKSIVEKQNAQLISFKKNIEDEQARAKVRFDLANINKTATDKKLAFMTLIPSGNPLDAQLKTTSDFGSRTHPVLGGERDHTGTDLRAAIGTSVQTTANGIVTFSGTRSGYGIVVEIEHAFGFKTLYAHLNESVVKAGQYVYKGMEIAKSGNTGRSTGPHLHYEVRLTNSQVNNKPLDAENFMYWSVEEFDYVFKNEKEVEWGFFVNKVI